MWSEATRRWLTVGLTFLRGRRVPQTAFPISISCCSAPVLARRPKLGAQHALITRPPPPARTADPALCCQMAPFAHVVKVHPRYRAPCAVEYRHRSLQQGSKVRMSKADLCDEGSPRAEALPAERDFSRCLIAAVWWGVRFAKSIGPANGKNWLLYRMAEQNKQKGRPISNSVCRSAGDEGTSLAEWRTPTILGPVY